MYKVVCVVNAGGLILYFKDLQMLFIKVFREIHSNIFKVKKIQRMKIF